MNIDRLNDALGLLPDSVIVEAARSRVHNRRRMSIPSIVAACACLLLVTTLCITLLLLRRPASVGASIVHEPFEGITAEYISENNDEHIYKELSTQKLLK